MTETIITVQGRHTAYARPERATLQLSVSVDGPERGPVFDEATRTLARLRDEATALHDAERGPITWWSNERVNVWSDRPWNSEGAQLPLVHHAAAGLSAKFSDFEKLAELIERLAELEHVTVGGIEWSLTEGARVALTTEVRSRAVRDAVDKASVFAQSIGLGTVTAIALADPGMLGDNVSSASGVREAMPMMARFKGADAAAGPELSLKPEDIEVSAVVDARFSAR